jgi:[histone H3]-lysine36 N-dimethyltransferase SETMAR
MKLDLEQRYVLLYLFRKGLTPDAASDEMRGVYGQVGASRSTAQRWFKRFAGGNFSLEDEVRSGRPSAFDDDALRRAVEEEPKTSIRELAHKLQESVMTVHRHLLALGKVPKLGTWVPHQLTEKNMADRFRIATVHHQRFTADSTLFDRILTCDETWVLHENVVRKRQWLDREETPTPTPKAGLHPKKLLHVVSWDTQGVVHAENIEAGMTINAELYSEILERVAEALRANRPERQPSDVIFLHDNALPHTARRTQSKLAELGWEILDHPPYSPDMAPSDFHLFLSLKDNIVGQKFESRAAVERWLDAFYRSKPSSFFGRGIRKLLNRWRGVMDFEGGYAVE